MTGSVDLARLRGRSAYPMPVQAAEIALLRELGETGDGAARLCKVSRDGARTSAVFELRGEAWAVDVHTLDGAAERLTCRAMRDHPVPEHRVEAIRRL